MPEAGLRLFEAALIEVETTEVVDCLDKAGLETDGLEIMLQGSFCFSVTLQGDSQVHPGLRVEGVQPDGFAKPCLRGLVLFHLQQQLAEVVVGLGEARIDLDLLLATPGRQGSVPRARAGASERGVGTEKLLKLLPNYLQNLSQMK